MKEQETLVTKQQKLSWVLDVDYQKERLKEDKVEFSEDENDICYKPTDKFEKLLQGIPIKEELRSNLAHCPQSREDVDQQWQSLVHEMQSLVLQLESLVHQLLFEATRAGDFLMPQKHPPYAEDTQDHTSGRSLTNSNHVQGNQIEGMPRLSPVEKLPAQKKQFKKSDQHATVQHEYAEQPAYSVPAHVQQARQTTDN